MTRMSREFSLVLLGSGILTAGYFLAPDPADELAAKADEQIGNRVAANDQNRRHYYGGTHMFIWAHSPGYTSRYGGSSSAMSGVSRGGFGGFGHASGAGG
jgi:hypothetical protein